MLSRFDKAWAGIAGPFITLVLVKLWGLLPGLVALTDTEQAMLGGFITGTLVYFVPNKQVGE